MSLEINLGKVRSNKGASVDFYFNFSNKELPDLLWQLGDDCVVEGKVVNNDGYLLLTAKLSGKVITACDRCLKEIILPLDINMEEKLLYILEVNKFKDKAIYDVEEEYTIFNRDIFDFTYLLQENILKNLPSKVLCKEDCQGLCPKCGKNLNEGKCNCVTKKIDPRFAVLAKLRENEEV